MKNKLDSSLGLRLLRIVFGCYLLVTITVTSAQIYFEYSQTEQKVLTEMFSVADSFEEGLNNVLFNFDYDALQSIVIGMNKNQVVAGVKVTQFDGEIASTSGNIVSDDAQLKNISRIKIDDKVISLISLLDGHNEKTLYEYKHPIITTAEQSLNTETIGFTYIYVDQNTIINEVTHSIVLILINAIIKTLALWLIFLYFVYQLVSKPLQLLTQSTHDFTQNYQTALHDITPLCESKNKDELQKLSTSFMLMKDSIEEKINAIHQQRHIIENYNSTLEQRIQERTQELADANEKLKHLSLHDSLTNLPNRLLFQDRMQRAISSSTRDKSRFAVGCIDLTKFKTINDTYGHDVGDKVLIEVAKRFSKTLRDTDTLARIGGDEFALIINQTHDDNAIKKVVHSLNESLKDAIVIDSHVSILTSANIGISIFPTHEVDPELLYRYADIAMYQAKRANSGYFIFDRMREGDERKSISLLYDLEKAIDNQQLLLHYQPIIDLKTKQAIGVEALVRWQHPKFGLKFPIDFIDDVEHSNLIEPLTEWVIRTACQQCLSWHQQGIILGISINISRRVFSLANFPVTVQQILDEANLEPKWVTLEITETATMANPENTMMSIQALKNIGCLLSIDDFGTGQSSLSYLTQFPFDQLKVDRSFIIYKNEINIAVIKTIIELARILDLHIVVEGVEDEATLAMLADKNCDAAQGYYFCKPNDAYIIGKWLRKFSIN